jgi:Phage Tail Collar Domain
MRRVTFLGGAAALAGCGRAAQMLPSGGSNIGLNSSETSAHLRSYGPARPLPKNPILGEVRRFDGKKAPREWSFCDGSILAIAGHRQLFSILGKTFGGDGKKTFALPKTRGATFVISTGGKFITSPKQLAAAFAIRKSR